MKELFDQFLKEKTFLNNVAPKTIHFYKQSFSAFCKHDGKLDKSGLNEFVVKMRESGLSPISCNVYIRGINSFLSWLYENEHINEHLRIKQLKTENKVIQTFTEQQLRAIISYKPKNFYESRLHALLCLISDTGIGIEEASTLKSDKADFDNLLITVIGKGSKERLVPMSLELRKILYRYSRKHQLDTLRRKRESSLAWRGSAK